MNIRMDMRLRVNVGTGDINIGVATGGVYKL